MTPEEGSITYCITLPDELIDELSFIAIKHVYVGARLFSTALWHDEYVNSSSGPRGTNPQK